MKIHPVMSSGFSKLELLSKIDFFSDLGGGEISKLHWIFSFAEISDFSIKENAKNLHLGSKTMIFLPVSSS